MEKIEKMNFNFKRTITTSMKATGFLDTDRMVIDIDGDEKRLSTLLSAFNGANVELVVKVKTDEELDEPVEPDSF